MSFLPLGVHDFICFHGILQSCCRVGQTKLWSKIEKQNLHCDVFCILAVIDASLTLDLRKIGGGLQTGCDFPWHYTRLQIERWPLEGDALQHVLVFVIY